MLCALYEAGLCCIFESFKYLVPLLLSLQLCAWHWNGHHIYLGVWCVNFWLAISFDALSRGLTIVVSHGLHAPLQQPQSAPPLSSSSIDTLFKVALPYTSSFSIVRCHTILSCSICYFLHLFRALLSGWSMVTTQLQLTRQALMWSAMCSLTPMGSPLHISSGRPLSWSGTTPC